MSLHEGCTGYTWYLLRSNPQDNLCCQSLATAHHAHPRPPDHGVTSDGVHVRMVPAPQPLLPLMYGKTYVPNVSAIQVLACIHVASFRLIWDSRIGSAGIIQRFSHYWHHFYIVWRGIMHIYAPRDAIGVQATRSYGPDGQLQYRPTADSQVIDICWTNVDANIAPQEDKVRAHIILGSYRIEQAGDGCNVTFIGQASLAEKGPACESDATATSGA